MNNSRCTVTVKFQTPVKLPSPLQQYTHANRFVCLGSCFATEIGARLESYLFDCTTNPLGNLFNPLALAEILIRAAENEDFSEDEFFEHQELWRHFLVHSSLSSTDKEESILTANDALKRLRSKLLQSDLLILTLGSAWVYRKNGYAGSISHNHKLPLSAFTKKQLTPDEISLTLGQALQLLRSHLPNLQVCVSVSPVRHLREGLHENNLSKASLLIAANQLVTQSEYVTYFPAYELLLDELRDYRFYSEDLTHPSKQAVTYIWSKFREIYFEEASCKLISETEEVLSMLSHRAQHTDTIQYVSFKSNLRKKIHSLTGVLPQAKELNERFERLP